MNGYEFAQQYYKRLADGEDIKKVNEDVYVDGRINQFRRSRTFCFYESTDYTWAPKTITVTIPAPMTKRPKNGDMYCTQDDSHEWTGDNFDKRIFNEGPIWSTEKDRDEAMRILKGGKSEA